MSGSSIKSFNFNKGHRRAIFILSAMVLGLILYRYYLKTTPDSVLNNSEAQNRVENFIAAQDSINLLPKKYRKKQRKHKPIVRLYPFNPNMISTEGLLSLGLTDKQANTIQNYLFAGGKFTYKEDLKKIYCINNEDYFRLEPYILLEERPANMKKSDNIEDEIVIPIELNTAQIKDLLSIRGVGPFIAKNIIKYRSRLGGFYNIEQLREVYGIDSAKYANINYHFLINTDSIKKTDLNEANYYQLQKHPYINKEMAFEITNHAKFEMPFGEVEELKELNVINDSIYQKIYHYFVVY